MSASSSTQAILDYPSRVSPEGAATQSCRQVHNFLGCESGRTIDATERLMATSAQAYAMQASMTRGMFQLHPRLQLFPLDAPSGSRPVCEVPLIDRRVRKGTFPVEVKGTPRASGRVVARVADGEILWPSGRALLR
jgi:hypothetical protein